ncbi:hypothetical protein [Streptomyces cinereoruber]|uniref:hypothetical protein n=1 Tax=Streptomyces cinereoruber TaxID=67260 RepID=UPI003632BFA5
MRGLPGPGRRSRKRAEADERARQEQEQECLRQEAEEQAAAHKAGGWLSRFHT